MTSVHDVAALLTELQRAQTNSNAGLAAMASSKLHKLAYFCQAYSLAWRAKPIFSEDILAAESGPVVAELFQYHPDITLPDPWPEGSSSNLSPQQRAVVETVFSHNSYDTGMNLGERARSHAPWKRARAACSDAVQRPVITHDDMLCFYRALFDAPETRWAYAERFMHLYRDTAELTLPGPAQG